MIMRGNTTDYIQKKDTHVHCSLKREYQNLEGELMFNVAKRKVKITSPSKDDMMRGQTECNSYSRF